MAEKTAGGRPLTDVEKTRFQMLLDVIRGHQEGYKAALVSATLDGAPVATIALVTEGGDDLTVYPVAVLATDEMLDNLKPIVQSDGA